MPVLLPPALPPQPNITAIAGGTQPNIAATAGYTQPNIAAIAGGIVGAGLGAILLLPFVAMLYTALSRRRRVRQNARAPAEGGCGSVGLSEHDKDSANEKSGQKIPVRAARLSYVHTAKRARRWHGICGGMVIAGVAPEEG